MQIKTAIYNILASIGKDTSQIDVDEPMINYMDSLDLVELSLAIEHELNVKTGFDANITLAELHKQLDDKQCK